MKGVVKRNQIIITSLAILIAVAGYLNYTERNVAKQTANGSSKKESIDDSTTNNVTGSLNEVSADALKEYESDSLLNSSGDIQSNDEDIESNSDVTDVNSSVSDENDASEKHEDDVNESEPGDAVFTSAGTFSANAKLNREQLRAQNKETLLNMINSGNLSDEQKAQITDEMIHITEVAELENEVETLLEAKGFTGAVVSINDKNVDVVVNMTEVSDSERAKIEDVVKRKTDVSASDIVITPISDEN